MKNKEKEIKRSVEKELKQYGIFDKKIIKELSDSTFDEYLLNLEKQNNENDAFLNALDSMRTTIKANYNINKFNKFRYSLLVSSIALTTTLIIAIIGWLNTNILYIFNIIYPLLAFITLIYFIYTVITYKKRNYLDFIIVAILFTSVIAITIQCFLYLYRPMTGNYYYNLYYDFPGTLRLCLYWLISMEPISYELTKTTYLFDPTLIASIICFSLSIVMYLIEKRKKHINDIS